MVATTTHFAKQRLPAGERQIAITMSKVMTTASPTTTSNTPAAAARSGMCTTTELLAFGRYDMTAKC